MVQRNDWTMPDALTRVCRSLYRDNGGVPVTLVPFYLTASFPAMAGAWLTVEGVQVRAPREADFLWIGLSTEGFIAQLRIRARIERTGRYLGTGAHLRFETDNAEGWMHSAQVCGGGGTGFPMLFSWPILIHSGDTVTWDAQRATGPGTLSPRFTMQGFTVTPPLRAAL